MERKTIRRALKAIILICLILVSGYFILNAVIQKKIGEEFKNISPYLLVKFSRVHANIFSSSVSFDSLGINFIPYNSRRENEHYLYFSTVSVRGISFLKFIFNKKLQATDIFLDDGNIRLDSFLIEKKDSAQSNIVNEIKWPFKKFYAGTIELKNTTVSLHAGNTDQRVATANIRVDGVSIVQPGARPSFNDIAVQLSGLNYKSHGYEIRLHHLSVSSNKKILELDSLNVVMLAKNQDKIAIPSLRMTGFDLMKLLNERILDVKHLDIDKGKVVFNTEKSNVPDSNPGLKKVDIENLRVNNLSVSYRDKMGEYRFNADASLSEINVNSPFDINHAKIGSVHGTVSGFVYSGKNYQNVAIEKIDVSSSKELVQVHNINISPRLGKYEFGKKLGHQADWMQAHISKVELVKPDFDKLLHQKLFADKIRISESKAYIFRDRRLPRPQKNIPLPVDVLKALPVDIRVKTCELATSAVVYEEYPRSGYGITGMLKIEKLNLQLSPLINHPTSSDPAYMTMNVEGSIMGSGITHGVVRMPLQKDKPYYVKGAIERLELTKLNSSSENLGKIRIKSGFLDFLSFDFTMTGQRSTGKIIGAYHHLIIQQLKKHTSEKNVADFASFALRHAIIPLNKDASLPERKRTGKVDYQRDPTRMVSYYFLQSLLTGVKKSFTLGFLLPK
jgi:hypothetical protein